MTLELSLAILQPQAAVGLEDAVPDVGELVAACIPVHVQVEHAGVHRLPGVCPVLVCFAIGYPSITTPYHH